VAFLINGSDFVLPYILKGYQLSIFYPKPSNNDLMRRLVTQTQSMGSSIVYIDELVEISQRYSLIVDAVFGFSFAGAIRPPFDNVIANMANATIPIISIDIPSGKV
jgi:NAD(P)H-hydrate epimerase